MNWACFSYIKKINKKVKIKTFSTKENGFLTIISRTDEHVDPFTQWKDQ